MSETLRFGRYTVELSHPDKVLFPDAGLTKRDLVRHYRRVAEPMLPYLEQRPVVMQRFPDGLDADGFYHKDVPDHFPDWIERVEVRKEEGGTLTHAVVANEATLVYLANQGTITPHVWLSRTDALHEPDRLVFDLDPPDAERFELVRAGARALRELLEELGLVPFVMTTGGKGAHVVVPLRRGPDFDAVRAFARDAAELLAARDPERLTTSTRKAGRKGRLFLDTLRNAYAQTSVPPYAVRARPGAPVAMPLRWDELGDGDLRGDRFTLADAARRMAQVDDPWAGWRRHARALDAPRERLAKLRADDGD